MRCLPYLAVIGIPVYVFLPLWIAVSRKIGKKIARRELLLI